MHPATQQVFRYFAYDHLPEDSLRQTSKHFYDMAELIVEILPENPEATVCLRKLLEAKDCAVRSMKDKVDNDQGN